MNATAKKLELPPQRKHLRGPLDSTKLLGVAPSPEPPLAGGSLLGAGTVSDPTTVDVTARAEGLSETVRDEIRARFLGRDGSGIPTYSVRD